MSNNQDLYRAESGISSCENYEYCSESSPCDIELSDIEPGDDRRGSRNPKLLIVTEAPDEASSQSQAYQGSITRRMKSIFCDERYGIGLEDNTETFPEFLRANEIYATSAIKCFVGGTASKVGNFVIRQCKSEYLDAQIESMDDLELIIPMGKVAAASMLGQSPSSFKITDLIGKRQRGILTTEFRNPPIVVLPHPSGSNPRSNPPIISQEDAPNQVQDKTNFQNALQFLRNTLDDLNYDVLDGNPDCWDSSGGLSEFL